MKRRKALLLTSGILGAALIGSELFLSGPQRKKSKLFSESDILFLDEVGEVILPETELSPGAKATKIGLFMEKIISDCYNEKEQQIFMEGIEKLKALSFKKYDKKFMSLDAPQKFELIAKLDIDMRKSDITQEPHFFRMIKELTIWGYFSSRPGAIKALRYNPIPGEYKGYIPYASGDKAWF